MSGGEATARFIQRLLGVIAAPTGAGKTAALHGIAPPADGAAWTVPEIPARPGRAPCFREVADPPRRRRGLGDARSRLRFLHAIHHIELSAIDLAVLACLRAPGLPAAFHGDFLAIARDEAGHAALVETLLVARGFPPGSDPVHHRLWDSARAAADLGEHLVIVPRFLEARGLDVSAGLLPRLAAIDDQAHAVISRIYHDEIGHVAIGSRWHGRWCADRGLDPAGHFATTVARHFPGQVPGPFVLDRPGRTSAGFTPGELDYLDGTAARPSMEGAAPAPATARSDGQREGV